MPELHSKWCKLSAIGKGYLVRKLMKTIRVQTIIESMRDTMNMALQLHQEARSQRRSVTKQDVDLHRRCHKTEALAFNVILFIAFELQIASAAKPEQCRLASHLL